MYLESSVKKAVASLRCPAGSSGYNWCPVGRGNEGRQERPSIDNSNVRLTAFSGSQMNHTQPSMELKVGVTDPRWLCHPKNTLQLFFLRYGYSTKKQLKSSIPGRNLSSVVVQSCPLQTFSIVNSIQGLPHAQPDLELWRWSSGPSTHAASRLPS